MKTQIRFTTETIDLDKLEANSIKKVEKFANDQADNLISADEKEDMEDNLAAIQEAAFDRVLETFPTIEVPDEAYVTEDYHPWAVQYENENYELITAYIEIE